MNRIHFKNVVPNVFSERKELNSDVWANDITFEKDKLYLVEADSGKGKSTFCSSAIVTIIRGTCISMMLIPLISACHNGLTPAVTA